MPKRDANGELRRLHKEQLHSFVLFNQYIRVIKSTRLRWAGPVARIEEGKSAFKTLKCTPIGKKPLGRPGENNIRMDLKEMDINTWNWVDSAQDRNYWRAL